MYKILNSVRYDFLHCYESITIVFFFQKYNFFRRKAVKAMT